MPLLNELLEQAAKDGVTVADDAAKAAAIEALKAHFNPVYLAINNLGFGAAQAKHSKEVTDANAAVQAAQARADKAEADLKAAIEKAPDVKTVNEQWEARERTLKDDHKKALAKLEHRIRTSLTQRDQSTLEALLVDTYDVPRPMAKVLAKDPDLLDRMDYDDNGTLSVRQAGQQIPFAPGSGQTHLSLLAEEVAGTVPKDMLTSKGDAGSGVNGGHFPGKGDAEFYEGIRKKAKDAQKAEIPRVPLQERIRNR